MLADQAHALVDRFANALELVGVAIIVGGIVLATATFMRSGLRTGQWRAAYPRYRSDIGRGILLGLELLVGADIISTITAPLTFDSVGLLAALVAIRTFLSFSLETEIEGCWPWQRASQRCCPRFGPRRVTDPVLREKGAIDERSPAKKRHANPNVLLSKR